MSDDFDAAKKRLKEARRDYFGETLTRPRTPEETAYDVWVAVHTPGNLSREVIFAALREAADAAEERAARLQERLDQFEAYGMPNVAAALDRIEAARREEREALRHIGVLLTMMVGTSAEYEPHFAEASQFLQTARSRAEEPQP